MPKDSEHPRWSGSVIEYRYRAFISYSHADERWARWLHRSLEGYRLPRKLGLSGTLAPIFRDRDDLASAADLSAPIVSALRASKSLIVICSPAAAQSRWVKSEIETFVDLHGRSGVLCLIVDGKPNCPACECYPQPLRRDAGAEPLGADVRPDADGKRGAKLKLIAGLLGIPLADLTRRDQRRRTHRIAAGISLSLAVSSTIAGLVFVASEANRQAEAQATRAEASAEEARRIIQVLNDEFISAGNPLLFPAPNEQLRAELAKTASRIDGRFTDQPLVRAQFRKRSGVLSRRLLSTTRRNRGSARHTGSG